MIPLDGLDFKYIHCAIWFPSLLLLYFVQKKKLHFVMPLLTVLLMETAEILCLNVTGT